ncbi:hypothetical protein TVAG_111740 [Trichomonas vaginalis G3]|uniref:Uncharacterized protein n=1 Tax=Trichomonas vaginalis (strain ATCC PRA-98 / G3) TaxID=412133 RepID=A2GIK0_TRIV3|nr:hypothetical protein TVAGG3_0012530 [Trichomonas vaginalis G3]EAX83016.1 hypothetical protein TVAG_111740 [Trichomonas vaginalis G3]KAI5539226.1 hypothetical protein TVAGG3_0012530 [Trichomonas vaginalis G3]|eukprot:XP_001295946.1 hypothetical protein [Trichomonas vaginalis G3]
MSCNIYETTYNRFFQRPATTTVTGRQITTNTSRHESGFSSNTRMSPLHLNPTFPEEPVTRAPVTRGFTVSEKTRTRMEQSGYWHSEITHSDKKQEMDLVSTHMKDYPKYKSNHEVYWSLNRNLIGSREPTPYSRQPINVTQQRISPMESTSHSSYPKYQGNSGVNIPSNVRMERCGFSNAAVPLSSKSVAMSDRSINDLSPSEASHLKHKDPIEYQNIQYNTPYLTTAQISYQNPNKMRAFTATTGLRTN